ncbi:MAG: M28 family peptidase [Armatimonadota bacterium]|jgi:glutaminyl-peptide cyclotransferase
MMSISRPLRGKHTRFKALRLLALAAVVCIVPSGCKGRLATPSGETPTAASTPQYKYPFDATSAFNDLKKQCEFGPRNPGSEGHRKCLEWIVSETKKTADTVRLQSVKRIIGGKSYTFTNVIAVYGDAPKSAILCAHWDTRPVADQDTDADNAKKPIAGANDGASGVAALLELGRTFQKTKPPVQVIMIFFDGEDFGPPNENMFLGSKAFANEWKTQLKGITARVDYGILLDMIGAKDIRIPRESNSQGAAPQLMDRIYTHAKSAGLQNYFPDEDGPSISDDHLPLINAGIPTVDLISFNYAYWHTHEDTLDKCSPDSLRAVGEVVLRTLYEP